MGNNKKRQSQRKNHEKQKEAQITQMPVKENDTTKYRGVPRTVILSIVKIGIPIVACVIVIFAIFSLVNKKNHSVQQAFETTNETETANTLPVEPLEQDAIESVNTLVHSYFDALASGDVTTIKALRDYTDETELIKIEKKSDYIESYDNIVCYTKPGITQDSYFLYVTYDMKFVGIDTAAPGLIAMYVYTDDNGNMLIDGDMDESITASMKLVTNQDDVVDLYNKVDVKFTEAVAQDEQLSSFLVETPKQIKTAIGEALAQAEASTEEGETSESQSESETEEMQVSTIVNEEVKATDTVNVRSSDSEEADKLGKVQKGTTLTRVEQKINGWSKVIYEGKEAYIKSDYLELVSSGEVQESIGTIKAKENVNVRKDPDQTSERLGVVQAGSSYSLLEEAGDWYKISFNGKEGYVKAEYFE